MTDRLRLLTLLAIVTCALGCDQTAQVIQIGEEGISPPLPSMIYGSIEALASAGGTLYLGNRRGGVLQFNHKTESWEYMEFPEYFAFSLAVDDTTLYVGGVAGIYRLEPDGETFTEIGTPGLPTQIVRALAVEGDTIYAIFDKKLGHSTNDGLSWDEVDTRPWHDSQRIMDVVVEGNIHCVFTERQGVFLSLDGGERWTAIKGVPDLESNLFFYPTLLLDKNTVYIGTTTGVYRFPHGTTTAIPAGLHDWFIISLEMFRTALYAGSFKNGLFRSYDGGKSWQNLGFVGERISAIAHSDNRLYVGIWNKGVFYSKDKGNTWFPLNKGLMPPPSDDE